MAQLDNLNLKESEKAPINTDFLKTNEILGNGDDEKRFNELINDSDVNNAMQKVTDKCCMWTFKEDFRDFAALDSAGQLQPTIDNMLDKYPGMSRYMAGLGLPVGGTDFLSLSTQQKLSYIALVRAVSMKDADKGLNKLAGYKIPNSLDNIVNNHKILMDSYGIRIQEKLKQKNLTNFGVLNETLKSDFGLNDDECSKFSEYLALVKKHPEFITGIQVNECEIGFWGGLGIGLLIGAISGLLFGVYAVPNIWTKNEKVESGPRIVVIDKPEEIARLLTAQQGVTVNGSDYIVPYETYDGPFNLLDPFNAGKKIVNELSNAEIYMDLVANKCLEYDLIGSTLTLDKEKKEIVFVVKKPTVFLRDVKSYPSGTSGFFMPKDIIGAETSLRENLEEEALGNESENEELIALGIKQGEKVLLEVGNTFAKPFVEEGEEAYTKCRIVFLPDNIDNNSDPEKNK